MARFEELDVWQRAAQLNSELYKVMSLSRDYAFRDQITRSGLSIPSNIAEGYEREGNRETAAFLNYAKGSAGELRAQIHIGISIGYIDEQQGNKWLTEVEEISRMLHALIKRVRARNT